MNGKLKTRSITTILLIVIFASITFAIPSAQAAFSAQSFTISFDSIKKFFADLPPVPFANFMIGGKQLEQNAIQVMPHMDLNLLDPRTLFGKLDNWFYGLTTVRLAQVVKPLGNLIADIFSFFADLIRQGVAKL